MRQHPPGNYRLFINKQQQQPQQHPPSRYPVAIPPQRPLPEPTGAKSPSRASQDNTNNTQSSNEPAVPLSSNAYSKLVKDLNNLTAKDWEGFDEFLKSYEQVDEASTTPYIQRAVDPLPNGSGLNLLIEPTTFKTPTKSQPSSARKTAAEKRYINIFLDDATLKDAIIAENSMLINCTLTNCQITNARLEDCEIYGSRVLKTSISHSTIFRQGKFVGDVTKLQDCEVEDSELWDAQAGQSRLSGCRLVHGGRMAKSILEKCRLEGEFEVVDCLPDWVGQKVWFVRGDGQVSRELECSVVRNDNAPHGMSVWYLPKEFVPGPGWEEEAPESVRD